MNGLFDQLRSAATSPLALGLLGGAAVGSPGFGLLMAPIIGAAQENAARNKTAAEQALEARALELERARRQDEAMQQLPGLLGAATAAPVADSLMGPPRPGEMRATDVRNARQGLLGALIQAAPSQALPSLLGYLTPSQNQSGPSDARMMAALGIPLTPEGFASYQAIKNPSPETSPQDALAAFNLQQAQEEATRAEEERERERLRIDARYKSLAREGRQAYEALESLSSGGPLTAGGPAPEGVRFAINLASSALDMAGFGDEAERLRSNVGNFDTYGKTLRALRNSYVMLDVGEGATNREQQMSAEAFPTSEMEPGAVSKGVRLVLTRLKETARIDGASEEALQEIQDTIDLFSGKKPAGSVQQDTSDVSDLVESGVLTPIGG